MCRYNSSAPAILQGEPLNAELSVLIKAKIDGKRASDDSSFLIPILPSAIEKCIFCQNPVVPLQLANSEWFDATVASDAEGNPVVDLICPHLCDAAKRHAEFLKAELDGEGQ
jgi:hypothetical protein